MLNQSIAGMIEWGALSWLILLIGLIGLIGVVVVWRLLGSQRPREDVRDAHVAPPRAHR